MGRRHYRQLFLFVAVLILPGVMIAVQGPEAFGTGAGTHQGPVGADPKADGSGNRTGNRHAARADVWLGVTACSRMPAPDKQIQNADASGGSPHGSLHARWQPGHTGGCERVLLPGRPCES